MQEMDTNKRAMEEAEVVRISEYWFLNDDSSLNFDLIAHDVLLIVAQDQ